MAKRSVSAKIWRRIENSNENQTLKMNESAENRKRRNWQRKQASRMRARALRARA
jgi:hypothetical protein